MSDNVSGSAGQSLEDRYAGWKKKHRKTIWGVRGGIVALALGATALSGMYTVGTNEKGVVTRFGQYSKTVGPGLHFKIPYAESVDAVKVGLTQRVEFKEDAEVTMITADKNEVVVPFTVQYRIADPKAYLFNVRNPDDAVKSVALAQMYGTVADYVVDEILTTERESAQSEAKERIQNVLNKYGTGIRVTGVQILNVALPNVSVKEAFGDVERAMQDYRTFIDTAKTERNKQIPGAQASAIKAKKAAEGYALEVVNKAQGDAGRFLDNLAEYEANTDVVRRRMHLDALVDAYTPREGSPGIDITVIDSSVNGVLPIYPLDGGRK